MRRGVVLLLTTVATVMVVSSGVALVGPVEPAQAAFPGKNGKIVFVSNRTTGAGVDNPTGDREIFTMKPDGTGLTQLTFNTTSDGLPRWSRDGKKIVFASQRNGNVEVYTMNADGSDQTNITNNASGDTAPAFSPDGTKIVFISNRTTGTGVDNPTGDMEIFTINADGTGLKQLTFNTADDSPPNWSPNGQQIAFTSYRDGNDEIYTMNADGSAQTRRTTNSVSDRYPAYSPDGKQIVFRSDGAGNEEIYKMQVDGSQQTLLSNNLASDTEPDWQPLKKRRR